MERRRHAAFSCVVRFCSVHAAVETWRDVATSCPVIMRHRSVRVASRTNRCAAFPIVVSCNGDAMRAQAFEVCECAHFGDVVGAKIDRPRSFVDDARRE